MFGKYKDPRTLPVLSQRLSAVAARMDEKEAAAVTVPVATTLLQAMKRAPLFMWPPLAQSLSLVAARMEPSEGAVALFQAMNDPTLKNSDDLLPAPTLGRPTDLRIRPSLARDLSALLSGVTAAGKGSWSATAASLVALPAGTSPPLMALGPLVATVELSPRRFSTQQLVELLKMPTCIGEARRLVLDELGNRHRRRFADAWEFVRFARERHLDLDFTTPPQRPESAAVR